MSVTASWPDEYVLHSAVRTLDAPDSPFPATLARTADGDTVFLVDREILVGWSGWTAPSGAHVWTPLDLVQTTNGQAAMLPVLTERLDRFLARRDGVDAALSAGEIVTLAVSAVRGLAESLRTDGDHPGQWWLAEGGRPVIVEACGDQSVRRATADLCEALIRYAPRQRLRGLLEELGQASVNERAFARSAQMWEDELFACASAEPLATDVMSPIRARATTIAEPLDARASDEPARPWWAALAFHVDAGMSDRVSDAVHSIWKRRHTTPTAKPRGRRWGWAAAAGAGVLAAGLLWPAPGGAPASAGSAPTEVGPTSVGGSPSTTSAETDQTASSSGEAPVGEPTGGNGGDASIEEVVTDLLNRRRACTQNECLRDVMEDVNRVVPAGVVDTPPEERRVSVVDDFGGVAVARVSPVDASGARDQFVTVVRSNDEWRVRDVYDVANPPS